jgi:hypothetical protein
VFDEFLSKFISLKQVTFSNHLQTSTIIYYDNQSSIHVAKNLVAHGKMKHFELHAHYLRQLIHENVVSLEHCGKND